MKSLNVSFSVARELMSKLEKEKMIGSPLKDKKKGRKVLLNPKPEITSIKLFNFFIIIERYL